MNNFDEQTIKDLEFPLIKGWLLEFCVGPSAKNRVEQLMPLSHFPTIEKDLRKVNELLSIRLEGETFPVLEFEELTAELKLLPIRNAVLDLEGYLRIYKASILVNTLLTFFDKREKEYPLLTAVIENAYYTKEILELTDKVFDKYGNIKDDASPLLFEIRQKLKTVKTQINRNFDKEINRLLKENVLGETKETFVNDRRVLTILSSHKRKIQGTVLGSSKSGSLTYIEPQVNMHLNNELELLIDDERKEIYKILQELTREIALFLPLIQEYQSILFQLDFQCKNQIGHSA
jgi:DNA mismatch repair protein MutS2